MLDIKQYIVSTLHFECKIELEDIDYTLVDELIYTFQNDSSKINAEYIKLLYFKSSPTKPLEIEGAKTEETLSINDNFSDQQSKTENKLTNPPDEIEINLEEKTPTFSLNTQNNSKNIPGKQINLPNAKVNENYTVGLLQYFNGIDKISVIKIDQLDETGLSFEKENISITGVPKVSGELTFILNYRLTEEDANKPVLQKQINLYINPDPRTLWTEHEPEADLPFPKSHTAHKELDYSGKKVIAASKRGRSHAKDGKFRDDHFEIFHQTESDWLILTVSDGAGSAKLSREGSKIFCQTVLNEIISPNNSRHFETLEKLIQSDNSENREREIKNTLYYVIGESLIKALKEVDECARGLNAAIKDFSCTFLLTLCKKINDKWFIAGYWVGDGGIGIYIEHQDPIVLGKPDSGEFSGQTRFVTMPEMLNSGDEIFNRIRFSEVKDFKYLALMTDGITDAWFNTDANLYKKEMWEILWHEFSKNQTPNEPYSAVALLEWLDFWVKGEYDDRTIVIVN